ncbi:hypothetical protein [Azospirillum largimobile]
MADPFSKETSDLSGGLFNTFSDPAGITNPTVIGYLVVDSGSLDGALIFIAANAAIAILDDLFIAGEFKHVELKTLCPFHAKIRSALSSPEHLMRSAAPMAPPLSRSSHHGFAILPQNHRNAGRAGRRP